MGAVSAILKSLPIVLVYATYTGVTDYFLWGQQAGSGVTTRIIEKNCAASASGFTPNRIAYTGIHTLDNLTCIFVTFFTPAFSPTLRPSLRPYALDFAGLVEVILLPLMLDSASHFPNSRTSAVLAPFITLSFGQLRGLGVSLPIYWLLSYLARTTSRFDGQPPVRPDETAVRASLFSICFGYIFPLIVACLRVNPSTNAAFQIYPIYIALLQSLWFFLFDTRDGSISRKQVGKAPHTPTYLFIQASYIAVSIVASFAHMPILFDILNASDPLAFMRDSFVPYTGVYTYASTDELFRIGMANEIKRALQWDAISLGTSSFVTAALAFSDIRALIPAFLLSLLGYVFIGGPALVAVPFMYKEWVDEQKRAVETQKHRPKRTK